MDKIIVLWKFESFTKSRNRFGSDDSNIVDSIANKVIFRSSVRSTIPSKSITRSRLWAARKKSSTDCSKLLWTSVSREERALSLIQFKSLVTRMPRESQVLWCLCRRHVLWWNFLSTISFMLFSRNRATRFWNMCELLKRSVNELMKWELSPAFKGFVENLNNGSFVHRVSCDALDK